MAHEIDMSLGAPAIAYANDGQTPWHGLGQAVDPQAGIDEWRKAGGLDWEAKRTPVVFSGMGDEYVSWDEKHVLYRSDTGRPLSVVSKEYQMVQPEAILQFFKELADTAHFTIETVGSLKEGRRIWALGRIGKDAMVMDDAVAPYVMLATSYDGSMATVAKFTSVRIVCNNTLQGALRNSDGNRSVTIPHSAIFSPELVRRELGIALDSWDRFIIQANRMANAKVSDRDMDSFLMELIESPSGRQYTPDQIRAGKGYQRIMSLFAGGQLGGESEAIHGTAWGLVNAVTQYVDHEQGRIRDNRLNSAWFGAGNKFKEKAYVTAMECLI